jgi:hypothetical protein
MLPPKAQSTAARALTMRETVGSSASLAVSRSPTSRSCGLSDGFAASMSAATPATKGDEKLVPGTLWTSLTVGSAPTQVTIGAKMSTSPVLALPVHSRP